MGLELRRKVSGVVSWIKNKLPKRKTLNVEKVERKVEDSTEKITNKNLEKWVKLEAAAIGFLAASNVYQAIQIKNLTDTVKSLTKPTTETTKVVEKSTIINGLSGIKTTVLNTIKKITNGLVNFGKSTPFSAVSLGAGIAFGATDDIKFKSEESRKVKILKFILKSAAIAIPAAIGYAPVLSKIAGTALYLVGETIINKTDKRKLEYLGKILKVAGIILCSVDITSVWDKVFSLSLPQTNAEAYGFGYVLGKAIKTPKEINIKEIIKRPREGKLEETETTKKESKIKEAAKIIKDNLIPKDETVDIVTHVVFGHCVDEKGNLIPKTDEEIEKILSKSTEIKDEKTIKDAKTIIKIITNPNDFKTVEEAKKVLTEVKPSMKDEIEKLSNYM